MTDDWPTYKHVVDREEWLAADWRKSSARKEPGDTLVTYLVIAPVPEDVISSIKRAFDSTETS